MRTRKVIVVVLLGLTTAACANTAGITYTSVPMGAMLSYKDGSGSFGLAPLRREYTLSGDCLRVRGVVATWVSGAKAISEDSLVFCGQPGAEFGITLQRPANYPGYDLDQSSATEFGTLDQSGIGWQQSAMQMYQSIQASQPRNADDGLKANCRSQHAGNQIYTNCD